MFGSGKEGEGGFSGFDHPLLVGIRVPPRSVTGEPNRLAVTRTSSISHDRSEVRLVKRAVRTHIRLPSSRKAQLTTIID